MLVSAAGSKSECLPKALAADSKDHKPGFWPCLRITSFLDAVRRRKKTTYGNHHANCLRGHQRRARPERPDSVMVDAPFNLDAETVGPSSSQPRNIASRQLRPELVGASNSSVGFCALPLGVAKVGNSMVCNFWRVDGQFPNRPRSVDWRDRSTRLALRQAEWPQVPRC